MKNKRFTYWVIGISALFTTIIASISYMNIQDNKEFEMGKLSKKITDECTDKEWDLYMASINSTQTYSGENVVSPNSKIVFRNYYKSCGHIEEKEEEASQDIVNMTQKQLEQKYTGFIVESFLKEKIKLYKEIDGLCDKHYLLIEDEGFVDIYKLENNGEKTLFSKTNISAEYLTEVDKIQLRQGIYVYGEEELNRTLEDFE